MKYDQVDELLADWAQARPELARDPMAVVLRLQVLEKRLAEQAAERLRAFGLEWWQYDVLSALRRQPGPHRLPASELATASHLSSGAMTHRLDRLEALDWVRREPGIRDRRKVWVRLTPRGRRTVDSATAARFEVADAALSGLTQRQRQQLSGLLKRWLLSLESEGQPGRT